MQCCAAHYNPPMTTLILALPLARPTAATEFDYVLSSDGRNAVRTMARRHWPCCRAPMRWCWSYRHGPCPGTSVRLPPVPGARLRAALDGLLEEQLLDEPAQLALALVPASDCPAASAGGGLRQGLAARGCWPSSNRANVRPTGWCRQFAPDGHRTMRACATARDRDRPRMRSLVVVQPHGVTCLPLASAAAAFAGKTIPHTATTRSLAEPARGRTGRADAGAAGRWSRPLAQRLLRAAAVRVGAGAVRSGDCPVAGAWPDAGNSGRRSCGTRRTGARRVGAWWACCWPTWSGSMPGPGNSTSAVRDKQQRVNALLVQTFPGVRTVVDAPLQMQRELALLRQASGAVGQRRTWRPCWLRVGAVLPPGTHASGDRLRLWRTGPARAWRWPVRRSTPCATACWRQGYRLPDWTAIGW